MTKARDIASAAPAPSTVSATEIGYLDGVSSAIQTQIDGKSGTSHNHDSTYVAKSLVDAKGDLLVGSANDTVSRLAVASTAGYVLTVDSAEATGLKWAAAGASFVGCRLYKDDANLSCASGTWYIMNFNQEAFDTDAFHSTSTNTSRITIPSGKAGYYNIAAQGIWATPNTADLRQAGIYKNGSLIFYANDATVGNTRSGDWTTSRAEIVLNLAVGDYLEAAFRQTSGSTLDVGGNFDAGYFSATYLGA